MFKWLKTLLPKKEGPQYVTPSWEEIIGIMYDKSLDFSEEVVRVIYSCDRAKRFVILKSEHGYFKYLYEEIIPFDVDELRWVRSDSYEASGILPAYWGGPGGFLCSFYGTLEEAMNAIHAEPAYITYFSNPDNLPPPPETH